MRGKVTGQGDRMHLHLLPPHRDSVPPAAGGCNPEPRASQDLQGKMDLLEIVPTLIKDRELVESPVSSPRFLTEAASCTHPKSTTLGPSCPGLPWASRFSKTLSSRKTGRVGPSRSQCDSLGSMFEDTYHRGFLHHAMSPRSSPGDTALLSALHFHPALKSLLTRNPSA